MSADLAIAIKVGASVGAALGGLRSLVSGTRDLTAATTILQKEYARLDKTIAHAAQNGGIHLQKLKQQQENLAGLTRKMQLNQQGQAHVQARLKAGQENREAMRTQALGKVAALGTLIIPVKAAIDFESSMADVRKVVDFETPQQFKQMEQDLLQMTHKIPMTANELAQIAASGGQLGIARKDIAGFTETIAKMSVAFDMSAEQAGDSMAKLANVYKIPIDQIGQLGDAINHLSNSSPAKASDIVNALGRVGGVARQFGLTELQTASLANAFISLGKPPEVAGTAINGMLTKLSTADKQGKKFQTALKSMGTSAQELKANIAKNGEQALMDFLKQVNKLPKKDQMGALVDLFGLEYADDVAVLSGSLETYQQSIDALQKAGKNGAPEFMGSMEKEFTARSATTANSLQLFKNQLSHLAISIGSVVLPAINELLKSLTPIVDGLIRYAQAHPNLIKNIFLAAAAFTSFSAASLVVRYGLSLVGGAIIGFSGQILALSASIMRLKGFAILWKIGRASSALRLVGLNATQAATVLRGLGAVMQFVSLGLRGMAAALLTNPITWIVAAIAAAALLIYTYWKPIKAFFIGFWQGLKDGIAPILPVLEMIGAGWKGLFDLAMAFLQPIIAWFRELGLVNDETAQKSQNLGYLFGAMLGSLIGGITTIGSMIINGWRMIFDGLFQVVSFVIEQVKAAWSGGLTSMVALVMNWSILGAIRAILNAIASLFGGEVGRWASYGANMIDGLINGISAGIGRVVAMAQNLAARVKSAFTGAMQIHSPSRVFRAYGGFMTEGLAIGVNKGASKPVGRISQLAGSLKSRFAERMNGFRSNLSARLSANADNLSQARAEYSQAQINNGGAITIHFNPTINAQGSYPQQIETALQIGLHELEKMLERVVAEKERRAY